MRRLRFLVLLAPILVGAGIDATAHGSPDEAITVLVPAMSVVAQPDALDPESTLAATIDDLDPERDDPARVGEYVRYFHPGIIGLSGSLDDVTKVAKKHFVIFEKVKLDESEMGYTMDHSSIIYVVGKDGVITTLIHHGESPEGIAKVLREALAG